MKHYWSVYEGNLPYKGSTVILFKTQKAAVAWKRILLNENSNADFRIVKIPVERLMMS